MRNHVRCHMASVAVRDDETSSIWIPRPCLRLENSSRPLARMADVQLIIASREAPVPRRVSWCPSCIGVLCLKNDQRWDRGSSGTNALDRRYPLLSFRDNLTAVLLRTFTNALEDWLVLTAKRDSSML
jgi:hypothetical protein